MHLYSLNCLILTKKIIFGTKNALHVLFTEDFFIKRHFQYINVTNTNYLDFHVLFAFTQRKRRFIKKIRSKNDLLWNIKAIYEVSQNSNDLNYMNSLLSLKG